MHRFARRGFTIIELLVVLVITGVLSAMALPKFRDGLSTSRLNRISRVVASDLELGVSLAARQRRPVRIECDCPNRILRVVDRASGTVLHTRTLGGADDLSLTQLALAASGTGTSAVVFPNGLATSQLTVTVGDGTRERRIVMSLSGAVRVN